MNLEGIINITGKTGLFKIISKSSKTVIAESLIDGKKIPLFSHHQSNLIQEIGIYTYNDTKPLPEIFNDIAIKENNRPAISHKSPTNELTDYFRVILADYDEERVYISDIRKVIQWYNIMQKNGLIKLPEIKKKVTKGKDK